MPSIFLMKASWGYCGRVDLDRPRRLVVVHHRARAGPADARRRARRPARRPRRPPSTPPSIPSASPRSLPVSLPNWSSGLTPVSGSSGFSWGCCVSIGATKSGFGVSTTFFGGLRLRLLGPRRAAALHRRRRRRRRVEEDHAPCRPAPGSSAGMKIGTSTIEQRPPRTWAHDRDAPEPSRCQRVFGARSDDGEAVAKRLSSSIAPRKWRAGRLGGWRLNGLFGRRAHRRPSYIRSLSPIRLGAVHAVRGSSPRGVKESETGRRLRRRGRPFAAAAAARVPPDDDRHGDEDRRVGADQRCRPPS